jgi:D-glycero-D-manno-heptose 1,7-bisphosphate phosphatase
MKKVIFLDRDGVINQEIGDYVYSLENFKLNEGLDKALKVWRDLGFSFAIITNQGGISKLRYSKQDVYLINQYLTQWFKDQNLNLLEISFCPHHNTVEACICRKPDSLMLEKLVAKYEISIENSFLIGDSLRDIQAANKIGLKGIQIVANSDLNQIIPLVW